MFKTNYPGEGPRNEGMILLYGLIVQEGVKQAAVTIGNTPTPIPATSLARRKSLWVFNNSNNIIYIGNITVAVADGFPLYPRSVINIQIEDTPTVYGISASGGDEVRILEGR